MKVVLTRRSFIGAVAALVASTGAPRVLAAGRKPFVERGESVTSLVWHLWDRELAPTGPLFVHEVLPWDGIGYPIVLRRSHLGPYPDDLYRGWYDFEWSNLLRDVPQRFWGLPGSDRYPNVHAYIREQRFGESPEVMRRTMERNRLMGDRLFPIRRDRAPFAHCRWNGRTATYDLCAAGSAS